LLANLKECFIGGVEVVISRLKSVQIVVVLFEEVDQQLVNVPQVELFGVDAKQKFQKKMQIFVSARLEKKIVQK
jgi:hypothetical protein